MAAAKTRGRPGTFEGIVMGGLGRFLGLHWWCVLGLLVSKYLGSASIAWFGIC